MIFAFSNPDHTIVFCSDGRFIPVDPNNRDYAAILESGYGIRAFYPRVIEDVSEGYYEPEE